MKQILTWAQIRQQYPDTFVLLDHCTERQLGVDRHEIVGGEVIFTTIDGQIIFDEYRRRGKPAHMTFGHTAWTRFEVEDIAAPSLRVSND